MVAKLPSARRGCAARNKGRAMNDKQNPRILALSTTHGGLSPLSLGVWDFLLGLQDEAGIAGDGLEIGLLYGAAASKIVAHLREDERFCGLDKLLHADEVMTNICTTTGVSAERLSLIQACSRQARRRGQLDAFRARCRFLHIDGEHSYDAVRNDLDLCIDLMHDGGIIVVDDVLSVESVCVTHALFDHVRDRPHHLTLFLCGANKAYLCAPARLGFYRGACLEQLVPFLERQYEQPIRLCKNSHAWEQSYLSFLPRGDGPPYMEINRYLDHPPV